MKSRTSVLLGKTVAVIFLVVGVVGVTVSLVNAAPQPTVATSR